MPATEQGSGMPPLPEHQAGLMNGFRHERVATKGAEINVAIGGN